MKKIYIVPPPLYANLNATLFRFARLTGALLAVFAATAYAEPLSFNSTYLSADDVTASESIVPGEGGQINALLAFEGADVTLTGANISAAMSVNRSWTSEGTNYAFSGISAGSLNGGDGGVLRLGGESTQNITIDVDVRGTGMYTSNDVSQPVGLGAIGLWAFNNYQEPAKQTNNGGLIEVNGANLNVRVYSESGSAYGIYAQNSTTETTATPSTLVINAENTRVEASSGSSGSSVAIVAMSQGILEINGNLYAKGDNAIVARGDAVVRINSSLDKTVQLEGDINFNYDKATSGTGVDADVTVNLTGADSYWTGNGVVSYGTGEPSEEEKLSVNDFKLGIYDGAQWNATAVEEKDEGDEGHFALAVNNLTLSDGIINVQDEAQTLTVQSLEGKGGTINLPASKTAEGLSAATFSALNVTSGEAGAPALAVNFTGVTTDDLTSEDYTELAQHVAAAGATQVQTVAEGDINGMHTTYVDENGAVTKQTSQDNTKLTAFEGVNAVTLVEWRNQINHLTKRMGDLRQNAGDIGAWARVYGGEYKWHDATVDTKSTTVQVGGDGRLGDWIVGGAFSYTDSSIDLANGDGDGDMYSFAVYGSRYFDCGAFLDLTARYGYIKNDIEAGNMAIDTKSNAFGVSAEVGHHFMFLERAYIEPQLELAYGYAEGDSATASNGVKIDQDDYQSLVGRIGFRTGFDFPEKAGTLYAHASYSYDFLGDAEGIASKGDVRAKLDEDLGGGWFSYGIGGQFAIGQNAYAYGEVERSTGGDVENPWQFNLGVRLMF